MTKKLYIMGFIFLVCSGFTQEIKLPEERIIGEDIRIEKTKIFSFPVPQFKLILPELKLKGYEELYVEGSGKKEGGEISFFAGSNTTLGGTATLKILKEAEYHIFLEGISSEGYRDNSERSSISFSMERDALTSRFQMGISGGAINLPGSEYHPFSDERRDFFSFNTNFSYTENPDLIPSFSDMFYLINSDEINLSQLKLQIDRSPFTFETGIERQDVFNDGFSSTALYQSFYTTKDKLTIGGTIKAIERYGLRFLPILTREISDTVTLKLSGIYTIPDLYRDILVNEYKEIENHNFKPEEEYRVSLIFNRKFTDTDLYIDISPSYKENSYGWVDADENGLLEPYPQTYWETSLILTLQHNFTDSLKGYIKVEKKFFSKKIYYYPEEMADVGFAIKFKNLTWNNYISYTGERNFPGRKLSGMPVINSEFLFKKENMEFGIALYNIADREYYISPGYPAEGRNILSFVKFSF